MDEVTYWKSVPCKVLSPHPPPLPTSFFWMKNWNIYVRERRRQEKGFVSLFV